jgi:hypothetical protein
LLASNRDDSILHGNDSAAITRPRSMKWPDMHAF